MLADYCWYCSCAADSPPAGFIVPAPCPPEPEEPSGAWEETEGSSTHVPEVCGSDAADVEPDTDAEDADAEAGTAGPGLSGSGLYTALGRAFLTPLLALPLALRH